MFVSISIFCFSSIWSIFTNFRSLEKYDNFEKIRQIHDFSDFVENQRNEGNWVLNGEMTFVTSKMTEIQREILFSKLLPWSHFWRKVRILKELQNQRFWVVQFGIWKVCLRGFAPQTHYSLIKLNFSKCLILQFYSKSALFSSKMGSRHGSR